jgi:pSer/pThr/pTyr-binding forkhead associated (FHA) protein
VRGYLLSWLARQYRDADLKGFLRERPEDWLVWEAGPWRPPSPRGRDTISPTDLQASFASGEPVALVLEPPPGGRVVRLGRAGDNELVIDEATLSRAHLAFARNGDHWLVRDVGSSNGTRVGAVRIGRDPVPIRPGTVIEAGAARLTFYDPPTMFLRLRGVA